MHISSTLILILAICFATLFVAVFVIAFIITFRNRRIIQKEAQSSDLSNS